MADELITIAGSLLGGGLISAAGTFFVLKQKAEKEQLQQRTKHERELADIKRQLEEEKQRLSIDAQKRESEMESSFADLRMHLGLREAELELLSRCETEFSQARSSEQLWQRLFEVTKYLFDAEHCLSAAFELSPPYEPIVATLKLAAGDNFTEVLQSILPECVEQETNRCQSHVASDVKGLEPLRPEIKTVVLAPVGSENQKYGYLLIGLTGESYQQKLRWMRRALDYFAQRMVLIRMFEDEARSSRVDTLTGLGNATKLGEVLSELLPKATEESALACMMIECDNLQAITEKYGSQVADELIKEMAALIQTSSRVEELNQDNKKRGADHLVRYVGGQFVFVLEDTDVAFAMTVADRIKNAVDAKTDWHGGVPHWTVSIGVTTAPEDESDPRLLLVKTEVALLYVKEKLGGNEAIAFAQVPRQYRVSKLSAKVAGSLEVFDPFSIIQSMSTANKTGILTVQEQSGRKFWAFFEGPRITKSHLGNFKGDAAVIEFLSTFDNGDFTFKEYSSLDKETMEEVHNLGDAFSVKKATEKHLIDGTRAQEKLSSARRVITNTRLFVRPGKEAAKIIAGLPKIKEAPTREELEAMAAICKYVNGRTMLGAIMDKLEPYPTYLRWHASALLVKHGAIELSKLAMSFSGL